MRTFFMVSTVVVCAAIAACSSSDEPASAPASTADAGPTIVQVLCEGGVPDGAADASDPSDGFSADELAAIAKLSPLPSVPADPTNAYADDAKAAALGQRLFFDKSYSGALVVGNDGTNGGLGATAETGKVACASCHDGATLDDIRTTPNNVSLGTGYGTRNALSLVNSSFYEWTNWGARFDSQWSLPLAVAENGNLMKSTRLAIAHMLYAKYRSDYDAIFPDPLDAALDPVTGDLTRFPATGKPKASAGDPDGAWESMTPTDQTIVNRIFANYGKALAAYVRKLVSRDSPFDRYVAGDKDAIDAAAKRGIKVFLGKGKCVSCHTGPNFSDDDFHAIGVAQTGLRVPATDLGRYGDLPPLLASPFNTSGAFSDSTSTGKLTGVTQSPSMIGQFRTKGLRGVALSPPYMHAGQLATLEDVVAFYDRGGDGAPDGGAKDPKIGALGLTDGEKSDLVAFLKTLTGAPVAASLLIDTSL